MGIDLDSCLHSNNDTVRPWARRIIKRFATYIEVSPSQRGTKLFFLVPSHDMPTIDALMAGKNRQTFAIGDHQEIAIDRNRFYAVTDALYGAAMPLRTVGIEDVRWLIEEAGPEFLESHSANREQQAPYQQAGRDESGSGYGFRFFQDCKRRGLDYASACAEIKQDTGKAGEWARKVDGRQLERAWHNANVNIALGWDDPDTSLLDDRRGSLPSFPIAALSPKWLQDLITQAAWGAGTRPDHVAVPLLGIASSLIGTARRVEASRSWSEPMTCWTAIVGSSGTGKSPGLATIKRPLDAIQEKYRDEIDDQRRDHELRVEQAKAAQVAWKTKLDEAIADGEPPPRKPAAADEPSPFIPPRLYVSDTTIEKMALLLQARPHGMLLIVDELAGLFGNMSRYSGGQDNQFWLMSWDGNSYTVERMGRPTISLDHLLVGIVGGLQPDKLVDCFKGPADGMYARFLFSWPNAPGYQPLTDSIREIDRDLVTMLDRLARLPKRDYPRNRIPLSDTAFAAFESVRKSVHEGADVLTGRERDWWSKIPAHVLRLAGTLAYLDWQPSEREPAAIIVQDIKAASTLVMDYFWPHARACLRQIGLSQGHADGRQVLRWLRAKGIEEVGREDVRRDALAQRLDAKQTENVLEHLEQSGWIRRIATSTGGRPRVRWAVNPKLRDRTR